MKKQSITLVGAILVGILFTGCGSGSPKLSAQEKALFAKSTPEIKQLFETGLAADKSGNYLSACTNYAALMQQKLTVDQVIAMQTAMSSLKSRIYDQAAQGDAAAKAALEYLNANSAHPGR